MYTYINYIDICEITKKLIIDLDKHVTTIALYGDNNNCCIELLDNYNKKFHFISEYKLYINFIYPYNSLTEYKFIINNFSYFGTKHTITHIKYKNGYGIKIKIMTMLKYPTFNDITQVIQKLSTNSITTPIYVTGITHMKKNKFKILWSNNWNGI